MKQLQTGPALSGPRPPEVGGAFLSFTASPGSARPIREDVDNTPPAPPRSSSSSKGKRQLPETQRCSWAVKCPVQAGIPAMTPAAMRPSVHPRRREGQGVLGDPGPEPSAPETVSPGSSGLSHDMQTNPTSRVGVGLANKPAAPKAVQADAGGGKRSVATRVCP